MARVRVVLSISVKKVMASGRVMLYHYEKLWLGLGLCYILL